MIFNYPVIRSFILIAFIATILSSCVTRNRSALFISKTDAIADTVKTVYVVNDKGPSEIYYKIKPEDILSIKNLQNVEFGVSGSNSSASIFTVDPDGTVNLPVIGKTPVSGLTRMEAKEKIQDLYSKKQLKDPIIELTVTNLNVIVLGEFGNRGKFLLQKDNTTLIDLLGQTGGLSPRADPTKIKIIRGDRSNPEIIYINLQDIKSLASPKLILQNNDIIVADPRKLFSYNENFQSFMSILQPVLVVFNTALIIYNLSK